MTLRAPPAQGSGGLGLRAPHPGHAMPPLPIKEPFANSTRGWQDQADHFLPWCLDEETEAYAPVGGAPEPVAGRQCALGARGAWDSGRVTLPLMCFRRGPLT